MLEQAPVENIEKKEEILGTCMDSYVYNKKINKVFGNLIQKFMLVYRFTCRKASGHSIDSIMHSTLQM